MKELAMKKKHRVISDSTPSYAPDPSKSHYTEQFGSLAFHVFLEFHFCTRCLIMILCIASPVLLCFLPYYFFLLTSPSHFPQISLSSYSSSFPVSSPLNICKSEEFVCWSGKNWNFGEFGKAGKSFAQRMQGKEQWWRRPWLW